MTVAGEEPTRELKSALNIEIPRELKERLLDYCEGAGLSQASATRLALDAFLAKAGYPRERRGGDR